MTILDLTLSTLRDMVSATSEPLPDALPPSATQAANAMRAFEREHKWSADIPTFAYPEEHKVGIFFEWCARAYLPDVDRIGGSTFTASDDWISKAIMALGKLVFEHGREAVEAEVRKWFELRLAELDERRQNEAEYSVRYDRCLDIIRRHPEQSTAIVFGHIVGHELTKLQTQDDPHECEVRDLRAEAGLLSPPLASLDSLRRNAQFCSTYGDHIEDYLMMIICDNWRHLSFSPDATRLLNDLYLRMYSVRLNPWWVDGYDALISQFGPDATPRKIIEGASE